MTCLFLIADLKTCKFRIARVAASRKWRPDHKLVQHALHAFVKLRVYIFFMYERLVVPQLLQVIDGVNVAFLAFGNSYSGEFNAALAAFNDTAMLFQSCATSLLTINFLSHPFQQEKRSL